MNRDDAYILISDNNRSQVYLLSESEYKQPVAIKIAKSDSPISPEAIRFKNEFDLTKDIKIEGVRKSFEIIDVEQKPALVMEYFPGQTLKQRLGEKMDLMDAIEAAARITRIISAVHEEKIIHRNINSENILIDPRTLQVKLIAFDLASRFNVQMPYSGNPEVLPGDLHYISPEQTGRMNRIVDYRSDLYSLGVVFYEMLTGRLPFESDDPLELVHAHIARPPKPLGSLNPAIPPLISAIVLKLLAKNAENRYQSASGLYADLEKSLTYLQKSEGRTASEAWSFELGQKDRPKTFTLPQKLYGRSGEISALLETFEQVAAGSSELFVITGHPGVGKSSLVAEVYKPITAKRGYFISGKFDQLKFNSPYSAFIQAFNQLIELLLNEPEVVLQSYREKILAAIGANGSVLTDIIPRLSDIIGKLAPAPLLSGRESRFRFNRTFQKFISAISTAEHPLIFFIDDWQWADTASLELLKLMFAREVGGHLFVIMAYRDNEVSPTHPLALALLDLAKEEIKFSEINLTLLEESNINMLIADALKCARKAARPLTRLVYRITRGNPFFNNQFLKVLHAEGLIHFDQQAGYWIYDISQVDKLDLTDDVVLFLATQLEKLPREIRDVLKLAACIGSRFDPEILAGVYQKPFDATAAILQNVLQEGLLIPPEESGKSRTYRFIHDRVQQAAYSLIPDDQKPHTHLVIGRLMLENTPQDQLSEKIFEIVNQLNKAMELHTDVDARIELAELNFIAGRKSKSAAAFASAWSYFKTALQLLPEDCWQSRYSFTLDLYKSAVETSFFCGDAEAALELIEVVNNEGKTLLDTISINDIKIRILGAERKFEEAIQTGLKLLESMGTRFPEKIDEDKVAAALREAQSSYREKNIKDFISLPTMTDPLKLGALQIMESIMGAAYLSHPHLYTLLTLKRMSFIFKHGNYFKSTFCYASFGSVLCGRVGDIDTGFQFGELALELLHRINAKEFISRIHLLVYGFIFHWKRPLQEMLAPIRTGFYSGLETGDLEFAGHNALFYSNYHLYAGIGKNISELQQDISFFSDSLHKLKLITIYHYLQMALQVIQDLKEGRSDTRYLRGKYYDETVMLPQHLAAKDQNGLFYLFVFKLILSYLFGDYEQAVEDAEQALPYAHSAKSLAVVPVFHLFDSLARLAAYAKKPAQDAAPLLLKINANQKQLKIWAHNAPMNCLHKYDLVEAVRHHLFDQKDRAIDYFDRAITEAKENGYYRDEALANELAAEFYRDWGKEKLAQDHMEKAYSGYLRWGAAAKADQLKRNYPQLHASAIALHDTHADGVKQPGVAGRANGGIGVSLDLVTVIKASQAIAGEIKLERLLRQMLLIMFENAGAQRGALIQKEAGRWVIQAQGDVGSEIGVLQGTQLPKNEKLATGIVHEVARTRKSLVLDNASAVGDFIYDPYISRNKIKSLICMPLINQGELSGILYLENNLATHAFTAKRLELLNLLSAQMALSLDNAQLYHQAKIEIAEKKIAEQSLLESRQKFKTIFDSVSDAIFVVELSTGNILDVNSTMCHMYGYTRKEALKLKITDLGSGQYPYTVSEAKKWVRKTTAESAQIVEWMAKGNHGRLFWVEVTLRRAMIGGKYRLLVTARDIAAKKQAEAEVEKLNQELERRVIERTAQLERANEELKMAQDELVKGEKLATLGNLTATVSHELRNPLGVIRSSNYYLQHHIKNHNPKAEKHFKRIEEQITLSNSILEELLEYAFSRKPYVKKRLLAPLMEQVVSQFKETDGIEIMLNLDQGLEPVFHDQEKMKRVMVNLLTNAVQAVTVKTAEAADNGLPYQPEISINIHQSEDFQIVKVMDNGTGMGDAVCQKAFEPLFTTRARGTGIGLSNVKKIIEEHHGRITLESKVDQGTKIMIALPLAV